MHYYYNYRLDVKMTAVLPVHLGSVAAAQVGRNMIYIEENPAAVQEIWKDI